MENKKVQKSITISLIVVLSFLLLWQILSVIHEIDYDIQVGEVKISTKVIWDLANGNNPYKTEWLSDAEMLPPVYYESGFFHLLPSVLLLKIFPISVYQAAAFVHFLYVVFALFFMFLVVRKLTNNALLAVFSMNAYFYCLNAYDCTNYRPDSLCSLICIIILYLLLVDDKVIFGEQKGKLIYYPQTDKSASCYMREWIIAFLCALLVFLKIHYASIIFALFFYYLKRRRVIPIIAKGAVFIGIFVLICNVFFPTFFSTFVVRVIEMLRQNSADQSSYPEMWGKWRELFLIFPCLFIITLLGIFKIKDFGQNSLGTFMAIHIVFNFVALCFMGKWPGNGIIYHEVMLMPVLIPASMMLMASWIGNGKRIGLVLEGILIISSLFFFWNAKGLPNINFEGNRTGKIARQKQIEELNQYKSEHMLLAPYYAFYAFQNDIYQWNYGDQIYIPYNIGTSPRWNFLFPYTNQYRDRCREYCAEMLDLINNKQYSIIITDNIFLLGLKLGYEQEFEDALNENYQVLKESGGFTFYIPSN